MYLLGLLQMMQTSISQKSNVSFSYFVLSISPQCVNSFLMEDVWYFQRLD